MFTILVIEDDQKLRTLIKEYLEKYNYKIEAVSDFKNIEEKIEGKKPDLVLLDINLPYYDGFYLCRMIRRKSRIPIIIISARNQELEQVLGIELGADDYITKPFSMEILLAKTKAALRRAYGKYSLENSYLNVSGIKLDLENFKLQYSDKAVELSINEFKLIKKLLENHDKILSREDLLETLWDDSSFVDDNTLTVNVSRLKEKLTFIGISGAIVTKRGAGYIFKTRELEGNKNE